MTKAANSQSLPNLEAIGEPWPLSWAETYNVTPGKQADSCPICHGKKTVASETVVNGIVYRQSRSCSCAAKDRNVALASRSGLNALFAKYGFDNYREDEPWQREAVMKARGYLANKDKGWFVMAGKPGSGKTHLCVAVCKTLLEQGEPVLYAPWREFAPRLKRAVNDKEYEKIIWPYKNKRHLFLDDLFKGTITESDANIAYELLNGRYNAMLPTIISTEKTLPELLEIDEAIGSRIAEMCKGYYVQTRGDNYRLKRG